MKKFFTILVATISFTAIYGQSQTVTKHNYTATHSNADIMVYYPTFEGGKFSEKINGLVFDLFVAMNPVKEHVTVNSGKGLEFMFVQSAQRLKDLGLQHSIDPIQYNYYANWHYFENDYIISICVDQFVCLGKDHVQTSANVLNIDAKTGEVIDVHSMINDTVLMQELIMEQYCKTYGVPKNALRIQTGLKYELANLPLAKTIGFTDTGIMFFYNRGEIASRGVPAIQIVVPYNKFKDAATEGFMKNTYSAFDGEAPTMKKVHKLIKSNAIVHKYNRK